MMLLRSPLCNQLLLIKLYSFGFLKFSEPERVWEGIDINPEVKSVLDVEIKRRLAPNEAKIRADFEMTCYSYEGIEGIKKALKAGEKHSIKDIQLKVTCYT